MENGGLGLREQILGSSEPEITPYLIDSFSIRLPLEGKLSAKQTDEVKKSSFLTLTTQRSIFHNSK